MVIGIDKSAIGQLQKAALLRMADILPRNFPHHPHWPLPGPWDGQKGQRQSGHQVDGASNHSNIKKQIKS